MILMQNINFYAQIKTNRTQLQNVSGEIKL